jgi:hypothetical protein
MNHIVTLHRSSRVIAILAGLTLLAGCNPWQETRNVVDPGLQAIDEAIASLETQSADWQQIVSRLGDRLPEDARAIVRDVEEASRNVIATGGVEARCNVDFFGRRLKESLQRLRNSIQPRYDMPPRLPVICQVSPDVINLTADRRLDLPARGTVVRMFGYNLDVQDRRMLLVSTTGSQLRDLTRCLDNSTTYQMTLNLGANACLDDIQARGVAWRHVRLEGFAEEQGSPRTLPVTYAPPRACAERTVNLPASRVSLTGLEHKRGDKDFWNRISYAVSAGLQKEDRAVRLAVAMTAPEIGGDRTKFKGKTTSPLNIALPDRYLVKSISTPAQGSTDGEVDAGSTGTIEKSDVGLVSNWTVRLNKQGDDQDFVGATVRFNPIVVQIAEDPTQVTCTPAP